MNQYFRKRIIQYFLKTVRINHDMAQNLLSWKHSGFSIDNSVILYPHDDKAKESLAQYIDRYPVSQEKIVYEPVKGKVLFHTKYNNYFKENLKVFTGEGFISELVQHVPLIYFLKVLMPPLHGNPANAKFFKDESETAYTLEPD